MDLLSADFDSQKQLRQCRDAITKGYKVLLIYPVAGGSIAPCVRDAKDAGVVVGSLDSPLGPNYTSTAIQLPGVVTQVMAPIVDDGRAAAEMTVKACADKDPCNVVLSVGDPANSYSTEKLKAEKESLAQHPQIKILGSPVAGFADPAKGYAAGRDILTANPDVDVIVGDTDATVRGIERAVKEAGKLGKIQLIGDGASQYAADAIADGRWFGSVIYMPRTSAAKATDLLIRAARGEKVPSVVTVEQLSPTKGMELTKAELSQFKPEYKGE